MRAAFLSPGYPAEMPDFVRGLAQACEKLPVNEFRPFQYPATPSQQIKARRWLGYWLIGLVSKPHRMELIHYRHCGEFNDLRR